MMIWLILNFLDKSISYKKCRSNFILHGITLYERARGDLFKPLQLFDLYINLAEEVRFELTVGSHPRQFSRL